MSPVSFSLPLPALSDNLGVCCGCGWLLWFGTVNTLWHAASHVTHTQYSFLHTAAVISSMCLMRAHHCPDASLYSDLLSLPVNVESDPRDCRLTGITDHIKASWCDCLHCSHQGIAGIDFLLGFMVTHIHFIDKPMWGSCCFARMGRQLIPVEPVI